MTIIRCFGCGKGGALPVRIDWRAVDKHCKECGQDKSIERMYHFCSTGCGLKFMKKLHAHKHKWKDEPYPLLLKKNKKIRIYQQCSVCSLVRNKQTKEVLY